MNHRKILRDNIQGITKNAIKKLAYKAGVKSLSSLMYEEVRYILKLHLDKTIKTAVTLMEYDRRRRVQTNDVQNALKLLNRTPYHRNCTQTTKKYCPRKPPGICAGKIVNYPKQRRTKKGVLALRNIRHHQKQGNCLIFPRVPFRLFIREIGQEYKTGLQFSPEALDMIQTDAEYYLIDTLSAAQLSTIHAKRKMVMPKDIQMTRRVRNERNM